MYLQVVSMIQEIKKNKLCEYIDSNVVVFFNDTNVTIRHEPTRSPKILSSDS